MITDPGYPFSQTLKAVDFHKPTFVCYRNKDYFDLDEIKEFIKFAKKHSKVILHYDSFDESLTNEIDGIHFPSGKLDLIHDYKNKTIIASTHNKEEVLKAKNADFITFSPIFESKNRKGLGIKALESICKIHKNVIALGGIVSLKEVNEIKRSCAVGFASIRYFYKGI